MEKKSEYSIYETLDEKGIQRSKCSRCGRMHIVDDIQGKGIYGARWSFHFKECTLIGKVKFCDKCAKEVYKKIEIYLEKIDKCLTEHIESYYNTPKIEFDPWELGLKICQMELEEEQDNEDG